MASNTSNVDQLKRAIELAEQIETLQAELNQIVGGIGSGGAKPTTLAAPVTTRKRHKMSKAARERIAAAQRARWAKQKGQG